ncbi:MAG: response regulator, partial [Oscillospiraceae bacterium]|nr:response regulator [Oscillospiraceae bacterium]
MDTNLTVDNVMANSKDTILIADDMEMNREILAEYFRKNYNILEAGNGIEVVETLKKHPETNAVLLDLMMPEMDGIEVLKKMHETCDILHIHVFIVPASNNSQPLATAY